MWKRLIFLPNIIFSPPLLTETHFYFEWLCAKLKKKNYISQAPMELDMVIIIGNHVNNSLWEKQRKKFQIELTQLVSFTFYSALLLSSPSFCLV